MDCFARAQQRVSSLPSSFFWQKAFPAESKATTAQGEENERKDPTEQENKKNVKKKKKKKKKRKKKSRKRINQEEGSSFAKTTVTLYWLGSVSHMTLPSRKIQSMSILSIVCLGVGSEKCFISTALTPVCCCVRSLCCRQDVQTQ